MREAHVGHVRDQVVAERAVVERLALGPPAPAAEMDLVDRDRSLPQVAPRGDPAVIRPCVADKALHDRGGAGRGFGAEGEGVGLERQEGAVGAEDLELVDRAAHDPGEEDLPDPRLPALAHRVAAAVPGVEVADHADAARVRRPDGEGRAVDAFMRHGMRAEPGEEVLVPALGHQVFVHLAEDGAEAVGVFPLPFVPPRAAAEAVGEGFLPPRQAGVEEAFGVHAVEIRAGRPLAVEQRDLGRVWREDVHDETAALGEHAKDAERVAVLAAQDRLDLVRRGRGGGQDGGVHVGAPSSRRARSPSSGIWTQSGRMESS